MCNARAHSAASATSLLAPATIARRDPTERDVLMPTVYPIVPGHEIVGRVTKADSAVTRYKSGDLATVGCLVDSDGTCPHCKAGLEQFCPNLTLTFNFPDKHLGGVNRLLKSDLKYRFSTDMASLQSE